MVTQTRLYSVPDVVARDGVDVEGPGGPAAPLEADGAQLVVAEEDGRLVDEDETALERVEEAGGGLVRARHHRLPVVRGEVLGLRDLLAGDHLQDLGDDLVRLPAHLLLQFPVVLLLQLLLREGQLDLDLREVRYAFGAGTRMKTDKGVHTTFMNNILAFF